MNRYGSRPPLFATALFGLLILGGCRMESDGSTDMRMVSSDTDSCAARAGAYAVCPAGYRINGGGHHLTSWDQRATAATIYPSVDETEGNSWHVKGNGPVGNACFTAYAICTR